MIPLRIHRVEEPTMKVITKIRPCERNLLYLFQEKGNQGLTDYEMTLYQNRVGENHRYKRYHLLLLEYIKDSGDKRITNNHKKNHKKSTVWVITKLGVQKANSLKGEKE